MGFDLLGLPQDVRNHIIGYMAKMPEGTIARALRVNRELNAHPLLLKAMLKTVQRLAKRPSYDVYCPECGIDTSVEDNDRAWSREQALCVSKWHEQRDAGTTVERSALSCRNCLQFQWDGVTSTIDPGQDLPDALETDGSRICFITKRGEDTVLVPVRELSVVREVKLDRNIAAWESGINSGGAVNPGPDWVLY